METTGILMLLIIGSFISLCLYGLLEHVLVTLSNRKKEGWYNRKEGK